VLSAAGDIDTLIVAPHHVEREDFFSSFYDKLKGMSEGENPTIKELHRVPGAFVPVIKCVYKNVELDLLFARLAKDSVTTCEDYTDIEIIRGIDKQASEPDKHDLPIRGCAVDVVKRKQHRDQWQPPSPFRLPFFHARLSVASGIASGTDAISLSEHITTNAMSVAYGVQLANQIKFNLCVGGEKTKTKQNRSLLESCGVRTHARTHARVIWPTRLRCVLGMARNSASCRSTERG
jgi:hypothetical protein